MGLTGKQIKVRNCERGAKRAKQRENHQKKREADIAKLLDDHEEELTACRSVIEPSLHSESPPSPKRWMKWKSSMSSSSKNRSHSNLHARSKYDVNRQKKTGLNNYFKDKREEWRRQQEGVIQSPFTIDESEERKKKGAVVESKMGSNTSLQMELYYLKRCLLPQQDKLTMNIKLEDKLNFLDQSYHPSHLSKGKSKTGLSHQDHSASPASKGNEPTSSMPRESSIWHPLPLNGTFTLPLDRISEVASNVSEKSLSETLLEDKEIVSEAEDSSTDTSWTVPHEVRRLLYNNP